MRAITRIGVLATGLVLAGGCGGVISGSGEVVTETRSVEDFERLQVQSAFDVRVRDGETSEIILRVDEAIVDRVVVEVEEDTLRIGLDRGVRFTLRDVTLEADVTVADLRAVEASGTSRVTFADPVESDELEASLSGASEVEGEVALDSLTATLSGASSLNLGGSAETGSLAGSGASELALRGLSFSALDVHLSGASSADVEVTDELAVELSGASDLSYRGEPRITGQSISGASSLDSSD